MTSLQDSVSATNLEVSDEDCATADEGSVDGRPDEKREQDAETATVAVFHD